VRLLLVGDVHLADRAPSIRKDGYAEQILDKLRFVVNEASRLEVDAIVQAGDMFHVKSPSRTSHALVLSTAKVLGDMAADFHIPVLVVPGNHDMQHDRLESLAAQPLGTLTMHPNVEMLIGPHPSLPLTGIPWLQDWGDLGVWFKPTKALLTVTHAPIFPTGEHPPYDYISAEAWASVVKTPATMFGHIHETNGVFHAEGHTFVNQGALSRGSLHEATLKRKPAVTLYDDQAGFTRIEVPYLPASEVFSLKEHVAEEEIKMDVEAFISSVGSTSLSGLSVEEVAAHAREADLPPDALKVVLESLEEAQHA